MKLFNHICLFVIFSLASLSINSSELSQYRVEFIIFEHVNQKSDEKFNSKLDLPNEKLINFIDNEILINKKIINNTSTDNWYSKLFKNISIDRDRIIKKNDDLSNISINPKLWFKKNNELEILNKINSKLESSNQYKILNSYSWIQNIPNSKDSVYLFEENINKNYGYFIRFYRNRFMHIDLKAYIGRKNNTSNVNNTSLYIDSYKSKLIEQTKTSTNLINNEIKVDIKLNDKNEYINYELKSINTDNTYEFIDTKLNIFIDEQKRIFNKEIHYFDHPNFGIIISINEI